MDLSPNMIGSLTLVSGCAAALTFVVGVLVGRRVARKSAAGQSIERPPEALIARLHEIVEDAEVQLRDDPALIASRQPAANTALPGTQMLTGATISAPFSELSQAPSQSQPLRVVDAIQQVVRRGVEAERKLAVAQMHLDRQSRVIRQTVDAARTDALTGLINRGAFDEVLVRRIAEVKRSGQPLSLALFDIDHFKQCNDQYGHPAGDRVLADVARVIVEQVREMDIVARYGGEEFVVVMPVSSVEDAARGAERVRTAVSNATYAHPLRRVKMTVSAGIAQHEPGDSAESLIARADQALYASKHTGRNRTSIHDGRTTRPVTEQGIVRPQVDSWTTVTDELKTRLGEMLHRARDASLPK
ncbi:MAG: GGDEF domain-containing protein [Planctomycetales bacterium]|nr:GGDEF domain-containing protein [Planctomycetales bacterium]